MTTVLLFVFLAFALVLSHQDVQKKSGRGRGGSSSRRATPEELTKNALTNLLTAGVPINMDYLYVTSSCRDDMLARRQAVGDVGIRYRPDPCYVFANRDLTMQLNSCTGTPAGATALYQGCQTVFLYYEENENTYMKLDPSVIRWFFTSRLSGCDVFVARPKSTAPIPDNKPIVIHSNMNECVNNVQNLKLKGTSVDTLINSYHPNYKLVARVYCAPLPAEREEANRYLARYERNHPGIKLISYKMDPPAIPQLFYFVGYYQPEKWTFILKGADDGQVTRVCRVPPQK